VPASIPLSTGITSPITIPAGKSWFGGMVDVHTIGWVIIISALQSEHRPRSQPMTRAETRSVSTWRATSKVTLFRALRPTQEQVTARLREAPEVLGLRFLGHVVVTDDAWQRVTADL
jgi:hypothetical protein